MGGFDVATLFVCESLGRKSNMLWDLELEDEVIASGMRVSKVC